MNKVLDSREPTLSTGSLWLPRVPSGSWGEEVTGTISCHSESPWTLMSSTISLLLKGMAPKKQTKDTNEMEEKIPVHRCTMHCDKIIIKNDPSSQGSAPTPGQGQSRGFTVTRVLSVAQLQCSAILGPETQQVRGSFASTNSAGKHRSSGHQWAVPYTLWI